MIAPTERRAARRDMKGIIRIDSQTTHGWQARPAKGARTKLFSDSVHGGTRKAFAKAAAHVRAYRAAHPIARTWRVCTAPLGQTGVVGVTINPRNGAYVAHVTVDYRKYQQQLPVGASLQAARRKRVELEQRWVGG